MMLGHDLNMQPSIHLPDFVKVAVLGECCCLDVLLQPLRSIQLVSRESSAFEGGNLGD